MDDRLYILKCPENGMKQDNTQTMIQEAVK